MLSVSSVYCELTNFLPITLTPWFKQETKFKLSEFKCVGVHRSSMTKPVVPRFRKFSGRTSSELTVQIQDYSILHLTKHLSSPYTSNSRLCVVKTSPRWLSEPSGSTFPPTLYKRDRQEGIEVTLLRPLSLPPLKNVSIVSSELVSTRPYSGLVLNKNFRRFY